MKHVFRLLGMLLAWLFVSGAWGAGNAPIVDLTAQTARRANGSPAEVTDIAKAFRAAGGALGWTFADDGPGRLVGTIVVRGKHTAVVEVTIRRGEYDLKYRSSVNLRFREESADEAGNPVENLPHQPSLAKGKVRTIHSSYHRWVKNLIHGVTGELLR